MTTLLTTKDVQELINVDKSTIYRMAEDGRLPAVKVGRQWRFPAEKVAELVNGEAGTATAGTGDTRPRHAAASLAELLDGEPAQVIADLVADIFGVMAVITDIEGNPLTDVANPCGYFAAIQTHPQSIDACVAGWRQLAEQIDMEPRFVPSHLGFLCARTFIRVGSELVGMVIVGGIGPEAWPPPEPEIAAIARTLDLDEEDIRRHIGEVYSIDQDRRLWILQILPRVSDLISRLADARSQLVSRLDA
ncbi:MAG: PocR ligand-binding domain-containing protein, partial [Acidimicrobiia bacterium]